MYYADDDFAVAARTVDVANRLGVKPTQVALAWLLSKPGITAPIIGASKLSHLDEAVESLNVQLSSEDIKLLEDPYKPHRVLGH
jgi:1-deoxyxylulose-5-phosphate synthase